jgi:predicted outer membrane repeat protein
LGLNLDGGEVYLVKENFYFPYLNYFFLLNPYDGGSSMKISLISIFFILLMLSGMVYSTSSIYADSSFNSSNIIGDNRLITGAIKNSSTQINGTIYVDNSIGDDKNQGTMINPKKSIKNAVNTVVKGGTVIIAKGIYEGEPNNNIQINKSVNINGDGSSTVIDGGNNAELFNIINGTVTFDNLTFAHGNTNKGGAINNNGILTLKNCIFNENRVTEYGGAIYSVNTLNIFGCKFTNNLAYGNSESSGSGAIFTWKSKCQITDSSFNYNEAKNDAGVINNNINGDLKIKTTTFNGNKAKNGGSIVNMGVCDVDRCSFENNLANGNAGVIFNIGILTLKNTFFTKNKAEFGDIGGGALLNMNSTTIKNCAFERNQAKPAGGAICDSDIGNCDIQNSKFNDNYAYKEGIGGAICHRCNGTLKVHNSDFNLNNGDSVGGAIFHQGSEMIDIESNNFKENRAGSGGALFLDGPADLKNNNIENNHAKEGGALTNTFIGTYSYPNINIYNNNFTKNKATEYGGCLSNNGNAKLTYNNFTMNNVLSEQITNDASIHRGGAIFNINGTLLINKGNEFFHNLVNNDIEETGGGLSNYFEGSVIISGKGNRFTDSTIYNGGYLTIGDCLIEENTFGEQFLNTSDSKNFQINNGLSIVRSNHFYKNFLIEDRDNSLFHIPYAGDIVKFSSTIDLVRTHLSRVSSPTVVHKGDSIILKSQLWESFLPWDSRIGKAKLNFVIYDKNNNSFNKSVKTNWKGYGGVTFDTKDMPSGNYYILIYFNGRVEEKPILYPCHECRELTILP